ncbi:DNRLRE domain-containing protein [Lysinibacillus capsici]|uniref:DNRLRE domain-containing protein n=1 Tax=Lysinibacillus capsici TaxID=2115968 RepID=UPI0028EF0A1E|nr:DNRLRE domain-containing protein [Lysinibacillus capsici]MED4552859.1 DNRLRE domain-containing protein [Lysinibacillus capsici]
MEETNIFSSQTSEGEIAIASIADSSFISVEYEVKPNNSFKAKYKLIAVGQYDTPIDISSRVKDTSTTLIEITSRAIAQQNKNIDINIMYRSITDVFTEIQPIGFNNLAIEIEVPPHNRMWANYEVQQPPIVTEVFTPSQDAFTRENPVYQSINYGSSLSMVVGKNVDDIWRSFVQFDLSWFNPSYRLTDAKLRLYYTGSVPKNIKLELLNADSAWSEYGITHLNRPTPIELITNEFTVNTDKRYVEFNTLKIVESWIQRKQINNGFIIRVANESHESIITFRTRESATPPELVVDYYDSRIFSFGRSQVLTEINSMKKGISDIASEIEVGSAYSFSVKDTSIYVHRKEVPLDEKLLVEITSTLPKVYSEIEIAIPVDEDIQTTIDARSLPHLRKIDISLSVTRPNVLTEIFSSFIDSIPVELVARALDNHEIPTEIIINRNELITEIIPRPIDNSLVDLEITIIKELVLVEITASKRDSYEVNSELEVINEKKQSIVLTEILLSRDTVVTDISSRIEKQSSLYAEISTTRDIVPIEIFNRYTNQVLVEIEPIIKSDIITEISVSKPEIWTEVISRVLEENNLDTEIFVPFKRTVDTVITAHITNNIDTIIDIVSISKLNVEITATKPNIWTELVIPTWVDQDVSTTIEPRILMVNNIATVIAVYGAVSGYAFIM